jgi:hypothetical protein
VLFFNWELGVFIISFLDPLSWLAPPLRGEDAGLNLLLLISNKTILYFNRDYPLDASSDEARNPKLNLLA